MTDLYHLERQRSGISYPTPKPRPTQSIQIWTLTSWPEDNFPTCTSPTCGREIKNGDTYIVIPGSIRVLCSACMPDMTQWYASISQAADAEEEREARTLIPPPPKRLKPPRRDPKTWRHGPPPAPDRPPTSCGYCAAPIPFVKAWGVKGVRTYCSRSCAALFRNRTQAVTQAPSVCPACDQSFWPTNRGGGAIRCCSKSCARYWEQGKKQPSPRPVPWTARAPRGCLGCGTTDRPPKGRGYCGRCYFQRIERYQIAAKRNKKQSADAVTRQAVRGDTAVKRTVI